MVFSALRTQFSKLTCAVILFTAVFSFCVLHQNQDVGAPHNGHYSEVISGGQMSDTHCSDNSVSNLVANDAVVRHDVSYSAVYGAAVMPELVTAEISVLTTGPPYSQLEYLQQPNKHSSPLRC